jgi:hypothetical protein
MTNRRESFVVSRIDGKRDARQHRAARMRLHINAAASEVTGTLDEIKDPADRLMRAKAGLVAYTAAMVSLAGPASTVAFLGSQAGFHGGEVPDPKKPVVDPWADGEGV